ncbi:WGR and DUF4132 domain-containing protein [Actinokineospora sp. G85]|uniref:WGR and DUF4132 domain-containing protein n=1 Tax=Actinokineospora sp. G85 TaxID=3406626 RepID=UPI003C75C679
MTRRLEYVGGGSEKFWEGTLTGTTVTARWGRLGAAGQTKDKGFDTVEAAQEHLDKLVAEKLRKGYSEAGAPAAKTSEKDSQVPEPEEAADAAREPETSAEPESAGEPAAMTWPDEERYDPPAALLRLAVPRRGRVRSSRRVTPAMVEAAEHLLEGRKIELRGVLGDPRTDPDLREAGLGQLLGTPSPLGAAVVFELLAHERTRSEDAFACLADQWIGRWGPAFAAEALLHVTSLTVHIARDSGGATRWITWGQQRSQWTWDGEEPAHRIRASLACADDDEYARAVEALAGLRDTQRRKAIVAYLLPTERGWVDEVTGAVSGRDGLELRCRLGAVETMADAEPVLRLADLYSVTHSNRVLPTLVDQLGPALAAKIDEWVDHANASTAKTLLGHLASFPTDEAMAALVRRAAGRGTSPFLQEALRRFPRRGARVLAEALAARIDVDVLEPLLSAHLLAWPGVADDLEVSDRGRAALDRLLAAAGERLPAAVPADLPPVLADPPWLRDKAKAKAVVVAGLEPLGTDAITWSAGEREEWLASADNAVRPQELEEDEIVWDDLFDEFVHTSYWLSLPLIVLGPEDLSRDLVRRLRPNHVWEMGEWFRAAVARFGLDTLDLLLHIAADQPAMAAPYLAPYTGPRVARAMADWLVRLKTTRATAVTWFARHGVVAARPLVPDALAKPGKARTAAEAALRLVAQHAGDEPVLAVAREYGPEAEAGVRALLAGDPLEVLPAKLPEVGEWANPALLPQLALADRRSGLSLEHARHVVTVLSLCKPGEPYAGLAQVKAATDPGSLARFAWRLFALWAGGGFAAKDNWVLTVLGEVGDDEVVRALTPLIRAWPGEGGHARAVVGLDVLADIGTDVALMHLNSIANKVKFKGLKERAEEKMRAVAERLGLSSEQLADRLVPDLGLDARGTVVLDYGPREFTVGFDEQLKPFIVDETGARRKVLPKPGAKDDEELAPQAYKLFAGLKKDVKTVATDQVRRLERAMVTGRRWSTHEFTELFANHPLLWHLVRRLVWGVYGESGALLGSFRLAEDRTLADAEDNAFTLPDDDTATVGVAHPLTLGEAVGTWGELFADYEILQPFPQLGRPVHRLTDEDRAARRLTRFEGATVPTGRVLGLVHRGWVRGEPQDGGVELWITKPVGGDRVLVLDLAEGIAIGYVEAFPEQRIEGVRLAAAARDYWNRNDDGPVFDDIDPIVASEFLGDLAMLTGEGTP